MSQIETIMLVALGFVGALLVGLLVVRGLWTYAVSLGKRRVERRAPSAIAELRADRDRLKAEYAMQGRRLQLRLDDLKTRMAEQMAEASRNRNRIEHLADEVRRRDDKIAKRDEDADNLRMQITALERELTDRTELLQQAKDLLQTREEISIELQGKLKVADAKVADQWFIIETLKNDSPPAIADLTGMASSKFESAQQRLRQRIEEMNDLTRQIDEQRQDLSVQQDELTILREQIKRSREADARATASSKAKGKQKDAKSNFSDEDLPFKSKDAAAGNQLEQKIIETERETEALTEELSRLDKMWSTSQTSLGIDDEIAARPAGASASETGNTGKGKKPATRSSRTDNTSSKSGVADAAKGNSSDKSSETTGADAGKSADLPMSTGTALSVALPDVKLPDTSPEVSVSVQEKVQLSGKAIPAESGAGNNNIISLAQRIRALHSDASGNT